MSRRRYVSTEISSDPRVNRLSVEYGDFAGLVYTWLIPHAADDGSLPSDREKLLYTVCPARRDKTVDDLAGAIDGMLALGLLVEDEAGLRFPSSFYKYQAYISEPRRQRAAERVASIKEAAPEVAQNGAEPRTSAKSTSKSSSSFSSSVSSSFSSLENTDAADAALCVPKPDTTADVLAAFKRNVNSKAHETDDAKAAIRARLKRWSATQLVSATENFAANEWEMLNNAWRPASWFFGSAKRVESYIAMRDRPPPMNGRVNGHAQTSAAAQRFKGVGHTFAEATP